MNQIQRILHASLNDEMILLLATMEKSDDFVWLHNHGYYVRKPWGGGMTDKGKKFFEKQNAYLEEAIQRNQKYFGSPNFKELQRNLLAYQANLEKGSILDGLTEDEAYAVRYLTKAY